MKISHSLFVRHVNWSYEVYEYDINAIEEEYETAVQCSYLDDSQSIFLKIASSFKFHKSSRSCALLHLQYYEYANKFSCVRIRVSYRWDVTLLIFLVYLICVVVSVVTVLLGYIAMLKLRRTSDAIPGTSSFRNSHDVH